MRYLLTTSALAAVAASLSIDPSTIFRRSNDTDDGDVCHCYGIDYQNGGSYFIDSQINSSFTCVSQFESSSGGTAYIILIRDDEDDQWECTSVPTTPDNTAQLSTCPITKDQMTTGNWTILTMGNNGDGTPFAWERNFYLSVGVPETMVTTPTITYTQTTTPSTTAITTSTILTTSSISNTLTITQAASTLSQTITPETITTTSTSLITRTSNTWTKTLELLTQIVTPSCTIPSRPSNPDPPASHTPTVVAIPVGVKIQASKRALLPPKRFQARAEHHQNHPREIARRSPDAPTITLTASEPVNTTTTLTAPIKTYTDIEYITSTTTLTADPATISQGSTWITVTGPTPTRTVTRVGYMTEYVTRTMEVTWTITRTTTPAPDATACRSAGGYFGWGVGDL